MKFSRLVLSALVLLAAVATARAETFGRTTVGATPSSALRADFKRGSKFTLAQPGTATNLCAFLDGGGATSGQQSFRLVLYRDVNGAPGAKLAETGDGLIYASSSADWRCFDIGWAPLTAGAYWLMIHTSGPGPGPLRYFFDGAANYGSNPDSFSDGAADPGGAVTSGNGTISIYATYLPGSALTNVGKMTIGATPSAGLRNDFKRGSSITFSQPGKVVALSAYLDGKGTGIDHNQQIQFALYEDVNGEPGRLVAQTQARYIAYGSLGRWYTLPVADGNVHAGKYWLMLHTGYYFDRIIRYMADGTGNWLGNADAFDDDSSDPFGPAIAGNGTISAFASYLPSSAPMNTVGYTSVGAFLNAPFADAYHEGYRVRLTTPGATLNGLYAYLDGLAGAAGAQQVRMAVYHDSQGWPHPLAAVSNVVTINSGQQPGWVKFDVTPMALPPGFYWISVHIGPTPGVIRMYYDFGGKAVYNYEDNFADGPTGFFNSDGELLGGDYNLSAYATFTTN